MCVCTGVCVSGQKNDQTLSWLKAKQTHSHDEFLTLAHTEREQKEGTHKALTVDETTKLEICLTKKSCAHRLGATHIHTSVHMHMYQWTPNLMFYMCLRSCGSFVYKIISARKRTDSQEDPTKNVCAALQDIVSACQLDKNKRSCGCFFNVKKKKKNSTSHAPVWKIEVSKLQQWSCLASSWGTAVIQEDEN